MAKQEIQHTEKAEPNTLKDQWGNERKWDPERYPEGSAAREGTITTPSGQGGATPKTRPDYQDQFPANPEPSPENREYAELLARRDQGEDVDLLEGVRNAGSDSDTKADREARTARVASKDSPK